MKRPLSIISVLAEAIRLGIRHFRLIFILSVVSAIPSAITLLLAYKFGMPEEPGNAGTTPQINPINILIVTIGSLVMIAVGMVINSMATAAILGVLKTSSSDWSTIKSSIRSFTWPLIILSILLAILACVITIPFSFAIALFGFGVTNHQTGMVVHSYFIDFVMMLMAILYLVFVKYALADPLIVIESMGPLAALKRSWQMTRGHFWYVLGSYIFLGTAEYAIGALFQNFESAQRFTWVNAIDLLISSVLGCYWILLAWCMYWRIKESEEPPIFQDAST